MSAKESLEEASQSAGEEVGYLLLEDCELLLDPQGFEKGKWLDIQFYDTVSDEDENNVCLRGNVVLGRKEGEDGSTCLILRNSPRFDGTMMDVPHSSRCLPGCKTRQTNRSDASLILGLAMSCQDQGHIQVETIQLMLLTESDEKETDNERVAFLVTFSMPWLDQMSKKQGKQKAMPPSTQLLFALMRSDWDHLSSPMRSKAIQRFQNDGTLCADNLFPSKMTLEELYSRIRGLQNKEEAKSSSQNKTSPFAKLPLEVLQEKIAPFLRARSLNSLRCSCSDLQQALKAVIPGLKLRLYSHQIRSLEWMREREVREWTENHALDRQFKRLSFDGDCHRSVTAGATVMLQTRRSTPHRVYRVDPQFGRVCEDLESSRDSFYLSRKVARGGLLCDDPGLGKTITVLSLILQTMGLSSEETSPTEDTAAKANLSDDNICTAYWREQVDPIYQRQDLNRLTRQAQRLDNGSVFWRPVNAIPYPDYYDVIDNPMCFQQVLQHITNAKYESSFSAYVEDVELIFRNAMMYNPKGDHVHDLAKTMQADFTKLVIEFKRKQIQAAKKSFSNSCARPNSSVAAILERKTRKEYMDSLIPSAATLLVVPETLLSHWVEQITMHVDLGYWTIKEPVIFNFRSNDAKTKERMKELRLNASVLKTQSPLIFIDHSGTSQLPHPDFLAMFKVMLTTTKRFVNEWKNGSFEAELKQQDGTISPYAVYRASGPDSSACPLLKVHWTRMVVDEGHSMGRGKLNNGILFASWISASRRWSMTGTPTPQTTSRSGMSNLLALMGYLKHEFFTPRLDGDRMWQLLSRSWNNGSLASFFQVRSLLAILMMRHTKLDIAELPPPKFHRVWLDMSRDEQTTFNTLVCAVQSNLLLTSMEGKTSGRQDSLLHKRQTRHARLAFENLRLACSGGLRVVPQINGKAWDETVELLDMHGLGKAKRKLVLDYMTRAVTEQRSHCMICGIEVSTLLVLPCGDLVCTECMTGSTKSCSVCDSPFDVDDFQRLQPGIVYEWYDYYKQEEKQKAESLSELEEITSPTRMANSGGGQADLAGQIALQPATATGKTKKRGDGHECEYSIAAANGKCKLCHEEHDDCVMIAEGSSCSVCHRISEICPEEESKFHHIVAQLDRLQTQTRRQSKIFSPAAASFAGEQISLTEDRPLKVIIFSQFRKVLNLIGHRLIRRYGAGAVAEFWGSYRRQELAKFKMSNDCFCMLLSKDGSEGLDLSFVTHIFFLEEIWDKSLQDQAVARAWRMGAKGHVEVETLLAKHTVESLMAEADQKLANTTDGKELESVTDMMRSKMVHILKNLRLMGSRTRNHQITKRKADDNESTSRKKTRVRFAD